MVKLSYNDLKKLMPLIGTLEFYETHSKFQETVLKSRDLYLLKKLKDLEWAHIRKIRGEN